jgi:plastocyanin
MPRIVLGISVLALLAAVTAGITSATPDRTVRATGDFSFVPNVKIEANLRWSPGPLTVKRGDTVTWVSDDPNELHTISVVAEGDVPSSIDEALNCTPCNTILAAHFPPGPPVPVLDTGAPGLDGVGDSLLLPGVGPVTAVVSAPAGTRLNYLCAIHPWMIGSIRVVG